MKVHLQALKFFGYELDLRDKLLVSKLWVERLAHVRLQFAALC